MAAPTGNPPGNPAGKPADEPTGEPADGTANPTADCEPTGEPADRTANPTADIEITDELQALWGRFQGQMLDRVETLDEALAALVEGRLDGDLRLRAERDAHRLTGSAGTFGRHRASMLAREL